MSSSGDKFGYHRGDERLAIALALEPLTLAASALVSCWCRRAGSLSTSRWRSAYVRLAAAPRARRSHTAHHRSGALPSLLAPPDLAYGSH